MAQFKNIFPVELNAGAAPVVSLKQVFYGDHQANRVGAAALMDGAPYPLGGSCAGTAIRADGTTVPLTGTVSGNQAYIDLDSACYQVEGQIAVFVKWVSGSLETTLLCAVGTVMNTETGTAIQPSTPIPDLPQLLAQIENMQGATAAAEAAATKSVRFDTAQSLTDAQKLQARRNIEAADTGSTEKYTGGKIAAFELGDLYVDGEGTGMYYNSNIRLRTPQGETVSLSAGDVAQFREGTGRQFLIYSKNAATGKYTSVTGGWLSQPHTITDDIDAVILLRYENEPTITDPDDLTDRFCIWEAGSDHLRINSIEKAVLYESQTLTSAEKAQARANINAVSASVSGHTLILS